MAVVRPLEGLVVDVEAVRVLHDELAPAQQAGAGPGLIAELGLDLVDREREVLVRREQVLHQQGEHLLVGRRQQEVVAVSVLQTKQVVAVFDPAIGCLVGLFRQQGREVDLLEARRVHLLAHDALDIAEDEPSQRQPGETSGRGPTDVAGPHEQSVRGQFGVRRVVAEGAEEEVGHAQHPGKIPLTRGILRCSYLVWVPKRRGLGPRLVL